MAKSSAKSPFPHSSALATASLTPRIPVTALRDETLLLFPRHLAPAYYDGIVAAFHAAGFSPEICAFDEPPGYAMLARLAGGREVGLAPASFAEHAATTAAGIILRDIVDPPILAELSMLWPANDPSPAIADVLVTARRCAEHNKWLRNPVT
ncbi:LysR substrate-binding domain-containing protein [Nocardia sp. NPDC058499]|uniref:LysR substrate-binding domain-containing protein n=1 Tax=Nocardia sp. NPDC058499 TaxID=3346530 RepID=UPI003665F78D